MGGQIIDATIVSAPKRHNSREDNETITEGETPEDWKSKPGYPELASALDDMVYVTF
jgi:hypothetical protein